MPDTILLILILVSIFIGFLLGRWRYTAAKKHDAFEKEEFSSDYFVGLNYLLNEQTDEAIDTFIKALEVSSDNVQTYIVIGRLFRRRGEIEKAIQTHQDILARPSLTREQSLQVQLELAHDYLKAGLLDRAESLLIELIQFEWCRKSDAVTSLLSVYEQEKEWQKAIDLISGLSHFDLGLSVQAGHYYAELADICLKRNELVLVRQYIQKSLALDREGVRALLQLGLLEYTLGQFRESARILQKIAHKNPLFIPESISLLEQCYERLDSRRGLSIYLSYCLKNHPCATVTAAAARQVALSQGVEEAGRFMAEHVMNRPSLRGMDFLIGYQIHDSGGKGQAQLGLLQNIVKRLLSARPVYRCSQCGFEGKELHWRCPRCHVWGMVEPVIGLEGK